MVKLICQRSLCKYCLCEECKNEKVIEEFKDVKTVTKVVLSISSDSCTEFDEDNSLIDSYSWLEKINHRNY